MYKVLLINNYCSLNRGSAAMAISTAISIKNYLPDVKIINLSSNPNLDSKVYNPYGIKCVRRKLSVLEPFYFILFLLWFFINNYLRINLPILLKKHFKEYADSDLIIDIVGDSFNDIEGKVPFLFYCYGICIGLIAKKKVLIYPQSIGPFHSLLGRKLAKRILNGVQFIFVREDISYQYLLDFKINTPISKSPDIAFLLPVSSHDKINKIFIKEDIDIDSKPIIGISANELIGILFKENEYDNYINELTILINYIVESFDAYVILIPHVFSPNNDDRKINEILYTRVKDNVKPNLKLIRNIYSPEELKGIISHFDIFIGARMHANIAALSTGVPTFALAYSHKTHGIMQLLGQEYYICNIKNITCKELTSKVNSLWENRTKIRNDLLVNKKMLYEKAMNCGNIAKKLLLDS